MRRAQPSLAIRSTSISGSKREALSVERAGHLQTERFDVRSADGTPIAVWVDGQGPALVMVHGAMSDHTADAPFIH
jgi:hypothetical protein